MRLFSVIAAFLFAAFSTGTAQTTETPVAFDTAGRILSVNPPLATRLGLTAPAWPVDGAFVEARLFSVSTGGYVLTVQRAGGRTDRFPLTDDQAVALRTAFAEGTTRAGRMVAEDAAALIAEPARGPFVRDQMLLASIIYGPSLASLTNDGSAATGAYLLTVGGTFFALNNFSRNRAITKAQNSLATDGALRGWAATALAANALGADLSEDGAAITALVGGIGGSMVGYGRGRNLTNSEAQAAMTGSTLLAAGLIGTAVTAGIIGENSSEQLPSAVFLAGGIAGYVMGPRYPRRAAYTVTAGDISLVRLGAILGTMAAITPFASADDLDAKVAAGIMTTGWIGGALIADRTAAKGFNHSAGDARMIQLGALGGGLMGLAIPVMMQSDQPTFTMVMLTGGGILGAIATQKMMSPARQGATYISKGGSNNALTLDFDPQALLLAVTKQRGNHSLLRIRF